MDFINFSFSSKQKLLINYCENIAQLLYFGKLNLFTNKTFYYQVIYIIDSNHCQFIISNHLQDKNKVVMKISVRLLFF